MTPNTEVGSQHEIVYQLVVRSPLLVRELASRDSTGRVCIPAATLRGAIRTQLRFNARHATNRRVTAVDELLFGADDRRRNILFSRAELVTSEEPVNLLGVAIDRVTGSAKRRSLFSNVALPSGATFVGRVCFSSVPTAIERCIALSALLELASLGRPAQVVEVQILSRPNPVAFVSYSWDDHDHMKWVRNLVERIVAERVDVILDQLSPDFDVNAQQEKINRWMDQAIANSDKILAIATPRYRERCERGVGGVGYEFQCLMSEAGLVSARIKRYVAVLRSGSVTKSLPPALAGVPLTDMRAWLESDGVPPSLMQALTA